jgi:hypothetical protein
VSAAAGFAHFGKEHLAVGDAAEIAGQAEAGEDPDRPLGGVEVPRLHAVAVVVLELVMVVVVALAEGEERHQEAVTGAAAGGVRLVADGVAERVDEEGRLLDHEDAEHAGDQETTESGGSGVVHEVGETGWQGEADHEGDDLVPAVLPHDQLVLAEVLDVVEGRLRQGLEKDPADVGPEEALGNVVRIVVVVRVLVVAAVVGDPVQRRVFERAGAEDQGEETDGPLRLEGEVGEQTMVPEGDAHARRDDVEQEHGRQEAAHPVVPQVDR